MAETKLLSPTSRRGSISRRPTRQQSRDFYSKVFGWNIKVEPDRAIRRIRNGRSRRQTGGGNRSQDVTRAADGVDAVYRHR